MSDAMVEAGGGGWPAGERERRLPGGDRRAQPTPRLSRYAFWGGRRRGPRRREELEGSFVDHYSGRVWLLISWIAVMNCLDSFFTIVHLQNGGIEMNPFAAVLLDFGRLGFVTCKSVLIAIPLVVLAIHKNFALARFGITMAAFIYTVLLLYHLSLF